MKRLPNIVIASCHDLGQHIGCYGVGTVNSPSLDRLAAEGVRFANSFCTAPQCSPSRAAIYTGRYPHSNGVMGLTHAHFAWDMHPDERHMAGILREHGYATALIGMQHERPKPLASDYDEITLTPQCESVAESTTAYLNKAAAGSKPFYVQIGFNEPHRGFEYGGAQPDAENGVTVPEWLVDEPSAREEFAAYQGAIRKVDAAFGTILDAIDRLDLADNTITIFTSDHGMPFPRAKCSLYDPGLQVPFIVRWPDRGWTGGTVRREMISNVDYLPTLLDAIGIPVHATVQGRSFAPLLDGGDYGPRDDIFGEMTYHDYYDPRRCIRTGSHKLIANFSSAPFFMDPTQSWRPATITKHPEYPPHEYHPYIELYDLTADPLELSNLADHPEHAALQAALMGRLLDWMEKTDDPLCRGIPPCPMHLRTMALLNAAREVQ